MVRTGRHFVLTLTATALQVLPVLATTPPVELSLESPWQSPNLLVEIIETVASINETAFFPLLRDLSDTTASQAQTAAELYTGAFKRVVEGGHLTSQHAVDIAKLALSVHASAPLVEAYRQYYNQFIATQGSVAPCDVWVYANGKDPICDPAELEQLLKRKDIRDDAETLAFDRIRRGKAPTVILYTPDFSSPSFSRFFSVLESNDATFAIRYKAGDLNDTAQISPLYLSGYGVEMALKNTDYLVIDDRKEEEQQQQQEEKSFLKSKLDSLVGGSKKKKSLFSGPSTIEPLTAAEIKQLSIKTAQYIAQSSQPLADLTQLAIDFPRYAKDIANLELDETFTDEVMKNGNVPGVHALWINGISFDDTEMDPFAIVRALQHEQRLMESFKSIGLTSKQAIDVITHPAYSRAGAASEDEIQDVYDIRTDSVLWWNDLEKDKRYKTWPSSLAELLKPAYPSHMRAIKKNIYNLVMVEDLASLSSLERIVEQTRDMIQRNMPIRFGLIPLVNDPVSETLAAMLKAMFKEDKRTAGMSFLEKLLQEMRSKKLDRATMEIAGKAYGSSDKSLISARQEYIKKLRRFSKRFGLYSPTMFLNGKLLEYRDDLPFIRLVMMNIGEQTRFMAKKVYFGEIKADANVYDYLLSQPYVSSSRKPYIAISEDHPLQVLRSVPDVAYIGDNTAEAVNMWIVADMDSTEGLLLAATALTFAESNRNVRLALLHHAAEASATQDASFSAFLYHEFYAKQSSLSEIKALVDKVLEERSVQGTEFSPPPQVKAFAPGSPIIENAAQQAWEEQTSILLESGLEEGFRGIVLNGRVVGSLPEHEQFTVDDFNNLLSLETKERILPAREALESVNVTDINADLIMRVTCLVEADRASSKPSIFETDGPVLRQRPYKSLRGGRTQFTAGDENDYFVEIGVVMDSLSETTQKWASILQTLAQVPGIFIQVYMSPLMQLSEIPVKRFYRYVFDTELQFDPATGDLTTPTAYFDDLPIDALYTLGVDTIKSWHVAVKEANVDLDNIRLKDVSTSVTAVYELEHILIEGHCVEVPAQIAPRGMQFVLGTPTQPYMTDTIVMANLGYFQLKAQPGVWQLALRPGRSSEVYDISSVGTEGRWEHDSKYNNQTTTTLALTSFEGLTVFPQVRKNPGMEREDVLAESNEQEGFWSSLSHKLFGSTEEKHQKKQADINIFSVASGQLYERFLSIMIASVMEHTESSVKFWFIENFLSPSFKNFVPHLAQEYGFEYEMVTYKWPSWLRAQKEKQRTIWGYKILFLDVLFPLDLDKVIFVDADQIVRTDLKELVDMDLHGAPYGYTPFCSDRTEMDGFRFWNQGYWKDHLQGKPYHISALYVIDLNRFRQMAAGDRLRAQYQALSADPNSLANLDQDLPNNMQHVVPIYSLPQEWLWCETWCSDESLARAKTIDLCNNPLTKEPKLDRARRQVPEWETYDKQIDALRKRVAAGVHQANTAATTQPHPSHVADEL